MAEGEDPALHSRLDASHERCRNSQTVQPENENRDSEIMPETQCSSVIGSTFDSINSKVLTNENSQNNSSVHYDNYTEPDNSVPTMESQIPCAQRTPTQYRPSQANEYYGQKSQNSQMLSLPQLKGNYDTGMSSQYNGQSSTMNTNFEFTPLWNYWHLLHSKFFRVHSKSSRVHSKSSKVHSKINRKIQFN